MARPLGLPLPGPSLESIVHTMRIWRERIEAILALEVLDRPRIFTVQLTFGDNQVEHKLGRVPRGWIVASPRGGALVAQIGEADARVLPLTSTAISTLTLTLWIW